MEKCAITIFVRFLLEKKSQKFFVILVQLHISNGEKSFSFFSNIGKIAKVEEKKNDS